MSSEREMQEPEQFRKVFIGGLSYKTTEDGLRGFYSQWGELLDCVVMTDKATGKSRGFGFVTYTHSSMVDDAMANRPHRIDGRNVQPKRAVPRQESGNPGANVTVNKIFIGGIRDKPVSKEDLESYFGSFGNIQDCVIMVEKATGKPRGFAFVEFDDYDPVDRIIIKKYHEINGVRIDVKKALPRDGADAPGKETNRPGPRRNSGGGRGGFGASDSDRGYNRGNANSSHNREGWRQGSQGWHGIDNWSQSNARQRSDDVCHSANQYGSGMGGSGGVDFIGDYGVYPLDRSLQAYPQGYGQDFGQNYEQSLGGGPMKGGSSDAGRSNPYGYGGR